MKLFTEEQVKVMLSKARLHNMDDTEMFTDDYIVEQQNPIELPSDDEIARRMHRYNIIDFGQMSAFQIGAKWVIDKIKQQ